MDTYRLSIRRQVAFFGLLGAIAVATFAQGNPVVQRVFSSIDLEKEKLVSERVDRIVADIEYVLRRTEKRAVWSLTAKRRALFLTIMNDRRFQTLVGHHLWVRDRKRISDVLCALTIFGEARGGDRPSAREISGEGIEFLIPQQDRAVVHHALIYQTMLNRMRFGKPYLLQADPDRVFKDTLTGTPAKAAVALNQYSCWNTGDPNLEKILNPKKTAGEREALEMAASTIVRIELGLIRMNDSDLSRVTSYYSPVSQRHIPRWARERDGSLRLPLRKAYVEIGTSREYVNSYYFLPFHIEEDSLPEKAHQALTASSS